MLREMSLTVALLFISCGALANAQNSGAGKETVVSVGAGGPLTVECPLRVEQRAEWRLNGSAVPADMRPAPEQAAGEGRLTARLHAAQARAHHAGLYTCSRDADAHRVRVRLLPPAAAVPSAPTAPSAPAPAPARVAPPPRAAPAGEPEAGAGFAETASAQVYYDVNRNLSLHCPLANADKARQYVWKKDDKPLEEVAGLKERYTLEEGGAVFRVKGKAHEDDFGNYTCEADGEQSQFQVRGKPFARLPDNTNVVENQNIKLQCKVTGKPSPSVWWTYSAEMPEEDAKFNRSEALVTQGRFKLGPNEQGVEDAALEIAAAERADAGVYVCHADAGAGAHAHAHRDHTTLRVKDMYAALWPFLGICAEVFVLCAIILVYEKRRTKPELDDSDTDNHDQKKS